MTRCTTIVAGAVAVASGVGGFMLGARTQGASSAPSATVHAVSAVAPPTAASSPASGDCRAVKTQLAICMAYHPSADEKDKHLAMCRADLDMCRNRPTLPACYDFIDMAPIYDRELGEADPSPETLERAKSLSLEECVQVTTWAERAGHQQRTCLKGATPPGFKERYGTPIRERPFIKACRGSAVLNAWFEREEERVRAVTGREPQFRIRFGGDAGLMRPDPDGKLVPWIPEEHLDMDAGEP